MLHRVDDLPAVCYDDGTQYWMYNDNFHREIRIENKLQPAIIMLLHSPIGYRTIKRYYIHDCECNEYGEYI